MAAEGRKIAWEPHGVWHEDEALTWTRDLGVHLVQDVFRGNTVKQEIIYSRMPGIGTSSRLSAGALENAADSLSQSSEAYIVIGGDAAGKASQYLRALLRNDGGINDFRHSAMQSQEVFDELLGDVDTDEFDDDLDEINGDSDPVDNETESDDLDYSEQDDSSINDEISEPDESVPNGQHLPKKRHGVKRK
jgi:hypothetical protein